MRLTAMRNMIGTRGRKGGIGVEGDGEGLANAANLGENMAFILRAIEIAEQAR